MTGIRNQMTTTGGNVTYTIPLRFWFNNNIGLALPLIALQYNDIKLEVRIKDKSYFNAYARGFQQDGTTAFPTTAKESAVKINRIRLINELIHLDKDERRLFSTNNHEYLITQVQTNLNGNIQNYVDLYNKSSNFSELQHKLELRFTYPVKELFWSIQDIKGNYNEDAKSSTTINMGTDIITLDNVDNISASTTQVKYYQCDGDAINNLTNGQTYTVLSQPAASTDITLDDGTGNAINISWAVATNTSVGHKFVILNTQRSAENKGIYEFNYWNNYSLGQHQMVDCNLNINGKDLMEPLPARFYSDIQQYQYHNSNGLQNINNEQNNIDLTAGAYDANTGITTDVNYFNRGIGIYCYSFALRPEDYQPSGSLNFSKLESAVLKFRLNENPGKEVKKCNGSDTNKTINVYALNYNVLRIMSGQAGLAFIN